MSRYRVLLTSEAKEDLRDLDGSARQIVAKALKKLEVDPEKRGAPLGSRSKGSLSTFRKLVVGNRDYRIVYRVEGDTVCVIWVIAQRSDDQVYQLAVARLATVSQSELAEQIRSLLETARRL